MPSVGKEMVIDRVDASDHRIGSIPRKDVFAQKAGFRVAHIFVFNDRGELLLQRLANTRDRHPGDWGSSVAAYLFAGENYFEAAKRRIREELGTPAQDLRLFGKTHMDDDGCTKFISLFTTSLNGPFSYDAAHIAELQFVSMPELSEKLKSSLESFTPTFLRLVKFYQARHT